MGTGSYVSLSPYLLKIIIDSLAKNKPVQQVYLPAVIYVLLYFFTAINFRALDWIVDRTLKLTPQLQVKLTP